MPGLRARLERIKEQIASRAADRVVEIVAVTKGFGADAIRAAVAAGIPMIGENYAQEAIAKVDAVRSDRDPPDFRLHFIGRLQSNKVRLLAPYVAVWESVDRPSLVDEIAKRQPGATVLCQVNATAEANKGGCAVDEVAGLVAHARDLGLDVDGLMTVGPTEGGEAETRRSFARVAGLATSLDLPTISMGMTHDLDIALDCGATRVRLGTALFGKRA